MMKSFVILIGILLVAAGCGGLKTSETNTNTKTAASTNAEALGAYSYDAVFKDIILPEGFGTLEDFFKLHEVDPYSTPAVYASAALQEKDGVRGIDVEGIFVRIVDIEDGYTIGDSFRVVRFTQEKGFTQFIIDAKNQLVEAADIASPETIKEFDDTVSE